MASAINALHVVIPKAAVSVDSPFPSGAALPHPLHLLHLAASRHQDLPQMFAGVHTRPYERTIDSLPFAIYRSRSHVEFKSPTR